MKLKLSLLAAALACTPEQHAALAFQSPSTYASTRTVHPQSAATLFAAPLNNHESNNVDRIGIRNRFSSLRHRVAPNTIHKSSSLFAKPTSKRQMIQTIPTLLFMLLRKIMSATPAYAATKSTHLPTPAMIGIQKLTTNLFTALRHPTKETFKKVALSISAIYLLIQLVEGIAASKRQKVDPTSEWGRYADKPAARGMALSLLMMKLTPYAILPLLLEKFGSKLDPETDKDAYEQTKAHKLRKRGGNMFADGLLKLGPLYIKIGQILSCRENLFPNEWIVAMEKLQDRVPAKSGEEAWKLAYEACPGGKSGFHTIFSDFDDKPLAAASLGQVHKARLRNSGEAVAIKIQRSRLRDIYDKDLKLMKSIAKGVDSFGGKAGQVGGVQQSWTDIFNDAETILYREIDYRDEADNAIRFANDFGLGYGGEAVESTAKGVDGNVLPSAHEWLRSPYTYKDLSSEKFLVMEFVPSIKVSSDEKLNEAGVTIEDREYLAEALAHSYLRQFCVNKFFSTDPHPGNLGIETFEDGRPPRLVFYDFGQACSLAEDQSVGILEVIESIIDSDAKKSVQAFKRMGVLKDGADLAKVEAKCQSNYDTGKLKVKKRKKRKSSRYNAMSQPSESVEIKAKGDSLKASKNETAEVKDSEVMEYFTLQSEYAFVARALSQMDGVGKGLDPDFDFISAAAPYLVEIKGTKKYLVDEAKKKLGFIFDSEGGMMAKEVNLFKSLGFEPKKFDKEEAKL